MTFPRIIAVIILLFLLLWAWNHSTGCKSFGFVSHKADIDGTATVCGNAKR